mmetsp:Transcript_26402/g.39020  ORF Transcript_26402/g.39020 Transcript_26402/m.39020 type:complete len:398 (+) Transcript_26402:74-1267(+)
MPLAALFFHFSFARLVTVIYSMAFLSLHSSRVSAFAFVRKFSTSHAFPTARTATVEDTDAGELLHPSSFSTNGNSSNVIPYPKSLSPSSILEFKKCPQSFLFQYLWKLRQPTNAALTKGIMCHSALEKLYDFSPDERTLENLQNLLRAVWAEHRKIEPYLNLFKSIEEERTWGMQGLQLLQNYHELEDPRRILRPNPVEREKWVSANLSVHPELGATSTSQPLIDNPNADEAFLVRGIIDRLDMVPTSKSSVALRLIDYKTGKAPDLKYSPSMNEQILNESMEQLKIYALLLRESQKTGNPSKSMDLRYLRLFYLSSIEPDRAQVLDYDLGETQVARDVELQAVHQDLAAIWKDIQTLVATQDPLEFIPCERPFCYCHKCRKRFVPGTLAEPESKLI